MPLRKAAMIPDKATTRPASRSLGLTNNGKAVAMTLFIAAAMLVLSSCQSKPVMTHSRFVHLPSNGWLRSAPLTFRPEYDDSTLTYAITLAIRHESTYRYSNLSLVVDLIAEDQAVKRHTVNFSLADEYGNWKGGGFGTLYQDTVTIAPVVAPEDVQAVVVWQAMEGCDTLRGLADVGVFVRPLLSY